MSSKETRIFYDIDADPARLHNRVVAVIGYGSQGHAHALNLRDSGVGARVVVGLRPGGGSWERARAEGLDVRPVAEAARAADVIMMLVPDQEARAVYEAGIAPIQAGFETLTAAGYAPEIAYFECMHELKLIVDLMYRGGMKFMRYSISDTAEYGDYTRGPKVITPEVRAAMQRILADIQSGSFAREWIAESRSGGRRFEALRKAGAEHPIEQVGAKLRAMMPWTEEGKGARDSGLGTRGSSPVSEPRAPKPEPLRT